MNEPGCSGKQVPDVVCAPRRDATSGYASYAYEYGGDTWRDGSQVVAKSRRPSTSFRDARLRADPESRNC